MSYDIVDGKPASYLGDGVYALFDGQGIWLHANDHKHPTDRIYLESEVLKNLNLFNMETVTWEENQDANN